MINMETQGHPLVLLSGLEIQTYPHSVPIFNPFTASFR